MKHSRRLFPVKREDGGRGDGGDAGARVVGRRGRRRRGGRARARRGRGHVARPQRGGGRGPVPRLHAPRHRPPPAVRAAVQPRDAGARPAGRQARL